MAAAAASPGQPPDWVGVLCIAAIVGVALFLAAMLAARSGRVAARALHRCPVCGEDAVQATESRAIDRFDVLVDLQCGQCGVWRRVVATPEDLSGLVRRIERDRRWISSCAQRMIRQRRQHEIEAFIGLLRREIGGAEDFLASTRPCKRPPPVGMS